MYKKKFFISYLFEEQGTSESSEWFYTPQTHLESILNHSEPSKGQIPDNFTYHKSCKRRVLTVHGLAYA